MSSNEIARMESSISDQMDFARMVVAQPDRGAQSILPESYRGNPANVLIAVGLGASMGLSPAESLYRIAIIKGKPTAGAELIAANVRRAGHRLRVRGDDTTCTATITRVDDPDFEFEVTRDIAWARSMGLASNDNYKKQAGTMLQWRAITAVARLACPEALYGVVYTPDEIAGTDDAPQRQATPKRGGMAGLRDVVATPEPLEDVVVDYDVVEDKTPEVVAAVPLLTKAQSAKIHVLLGEQGMGEREAGLACLSDILDQPIASTKDLTKVQASEVIEKLTLPLKTGTGEIVTDVEPVWA